MAQFKCLLTNVKHFSGEVVGVLAFDSNRALMVSPKGKLKWIVVDSAMTCVDPQPGLMGNVESDRLEDEQRGEDISKFTEGVGAGSGASSITDKNPAAESAT